MTVNNRKLPKITAEFYDSPNLVNIKVEDLISLCELRKRIKDKNDIEDVLYKYIYNNSKKVKINIKCEI